MTIEDEYFKLIPVNDHSNFFNLELLYNVGGKNPKKEFKLVAYGLTLPVAIKYVINYLINNKHINESITLKQYLDEYKKYQNSIESKYSL